MGMQCLVKWLRGQLEGMKWILMPVLVVLEQINWKLLDTTNEVCKVNLFLDSYEPVKEVMVVRCGTVWTSPDTGHEYLLVGNQMLWFRNQMKHSLINPNQICEYGLPAYDDSFLTHILVSMETKPSFPSIPQGQLWTLRLVC
jgi:hypothetical protein